MTIPLPALAVAVAAFSVWLTVRIVNRRERWAKRTALALVVACVVYPLSFGPACWLCEKGFLAQRTGWILYRPFTWLCVHGSENMRISLRRYALKCGDHPRIETFYGPGMSLTWLDAWVKRKSNSVSPIDFEFEYADCQRHRAEGISVNPPAQKSGAAAESD